MIYIFVNNTKFNINILIVYLIAFNTNLIYKG
jgi:hypothetical protein